MSEHQIRLFHHLAEYSQENSQSESLIYTEVPSRTHSFQVRLPISRLHKHFYILRLPSSCSQGHSVSLADSPSWSQGYHVFLLGLFCCHLFSLTQGRSVLDSEF